MFFSRSAGEKLPNLVLEKALYKPKERLQCVNGDWYNSSWADGGFECRGFRISGLGFRVLLRGSRHHLTLDALRV